LRVCSRGKKWYLRARPPGERNPISILIGPYGREERAFTLKEAKATAQAWKEDIAEGGDPREEARKARDNSFRGVREAFLKRGRTAMGQPWKENTKAAYTSALEHPKLKKWEDTPVVQISHANVQSHINSLEEDQKFTTARRHLAYLRTFFAWCRRRKQGFIPPGSPLPTDGIELERPRDSARKRELTPAEIKIFWGATQKLEYPWGPYYRKLLLTGQRLNEVAGMRRDEVSRAKWTQT
jgi:integrase